MLSQLESQPEYGGGSESGGCGDDEPGDDADGDEDEEDEDDIVLLEPWLATMRVIQLATFANTDELVVRLVQ
nr:hypothetical protein [Tanacetum cinerariifolium]